MTDSLASLARAPRERAEPRRPLDEPARQEQDDRDEQRAEDQQVEVDPSDREELLEEDVEDRAQQGAMDRPDAADERDEEGVEGPGRAEGVRRIVADMVVGEESAGEPGERRRERERQGADGKVGAAEPEGRRADEEREHDGDGGAGDHGGEHRRPGDPERTGRQGAESEERRVPQIHLARVARDDVPALRECDREEDEEEEVQHVVALDDERDRGQRDGGREPDRAGAPPAHRTNSPRGRATRTTKKMTSPTTSR